MESRHLPLQPFFHYLKFERRYSQHTLAAYQTDLSAFFDYLHGQFGEMPVEQISHTFIRSWLASLKDGRLSAKSINRKISSLKSFFKYAVKTGVIEQTPMTKVTAPKIEKRLPHFVADKDMATLFDHVEFPDDWKGRTDRLLLQLFYQTGMRLSEAIGLKENTVNYANGSLKVLGKGNKERLIPVQPQLLGAIKDYTEAKEKKFTEGASANLLVTEKGSPLQPRPVYTSVKQYLSLVTTVQKRSPHVLRHTFATHLMNNGADLNAVKELLGHSSLAATQVYTHNTIEKLKSAHKKAHPKA